VDYESLSEEESEDDESNDWTQRCFQSEEVDDAARIGLRNAYRCENVSVEEVDYEFLRKNAGMNYEATEVDF